MVKKFIIFIMSLITILSLTSINIYAIEYKTVDGVVYEKNTDGTAGKAYTGFLTNKNGRTYCKSGKKLSEGWCFYTVNNKMTKTKPEDTATVKKIYYISKNGYFMTGKHVINNYLYEFDSKGVLLSDYENAELFAVPNYLCTVNSPVILICNTDKYYGIEQCSVNETAGLKEAGAVENVRIMFEPLTLNNVYESNFLPEGTKLYYNEKKDEYIAVFKNNLLKTEGAARLVTFEKFYKKFKNIPEHEVTIYNGKNYKAVSFVQLDALTSEYLSGTAEYFGKINKQTDEPENSFESNVYSAGTRLYAQGEYIIAVYPDSVTGVQIAEMLAYG